MAQGPQQFTPSQILEAGRRAEGEGQLEYAIQFYRHLTDHLAWTPEAATARDQLSRLGASPTPGAGTFPAAKPAPAANLNGHYQTSSAMPTGTHPMNGSAGSQSPIGASPAAAPAASARPQNQPGHHAPGALVVRSTTPSAPGAETAPRRKFVLPKSRRRYRTGRFLARAFTVIGFVEAVFGVLLIGAGFFARGSSAAALPEALAAYQQVIGVSLGLSVLVFGLVQVLGGQLARAAFDTASANRDLAAYARARAVFDTGGVDDDPPRD